jgi:hypothetical protein
VGSPGASIVPGSGALPFVPPPLAKTNSWSGRAEKDEFRFKENAINDFVSVTGESKEGASFYLESCNWDGTAAYELYKRMTS